MATVRCIILYDGIFGEIRSGDKLPEDILPDIEFSNLNGVASLLGNVGKVAVVNATETGVEWASLITDHNDLLNIQGGDTDEYYHLTASEYAGVQNLIGTNFVEDFLDLGDTPSSYLGQGGKAVAVRVNETEDGLEFVEDSAYGGASAFLDLTDAPASYSGQAGKILAVNEAENGLEFVEDAYGGTESGGTDVLQTQIFS